MKEIKSPLKEKFLLVIEQDTLLTMFRPKYIWSQFESISDQIKQQTYALIKELVFQGYLTEVQCHNGIRYYSETEKLGDFRFDHCKAKATKILSKKLENISKEYYKKVSEIQLTTELLEETPELDFCLKKYISHIDLDINHIIKKKENIKNIIKKIESCIY